MRIKKAIQESIAVKEAIMQDESLLQGIQDVADLCVTTFKEKGQVLFCGNGGSAADAQHLAAELSGRFYFDRPPLNAEALHVNTSYITAVANDYSYDEIFSRLVEAKGKPGDILMGLSTSGNSANIIRAFEKARSMNIKTVALTGMGGGKANGMVDFLLDVPSGDTPRIQEAHILIGHIICELVESQLFTESK